MLVVARAIQGAAAGGLMTLARPQWATSCRRASAAATRATSRRRSRSPPSLGPLLGGVLVDHASWRWVFYVNLPVGARGAGRPAAAPARALRSSAARRPLDALGAGCWPWPTSALMLACIWGGTRYAWGSAAIVALIAAGLGLAGALLVMRERRAADPIVPLDLLRTRAVALASAALFLATATLFAITVFVPLFLQTTTGASPTEAGPAADPDDARHHGCRRTSPAG